MTKNRTVNFLTGPSIETLAELAIALSLANPLPKGEHGGLLDLGLNAPIGGTFRPDNGEHCSHLALLLLRLCSRNAPPSWMLRSRRPLSPHSRSAIHLEATLNLFVKMAICPSCRPPSSLPFLPSSCVLSPQPSSLHIAKWPHAEPRSTTDNYL